MEKNSIEQNLMKKIALIVAVVLLFIGFTYYLDKVTRLRKNGPASSVSRPKPAKEAPDVAFKDLNDKDVTLAQYRGKVVLVNFWATWCEPCRVEIPWLIEMQQKSGPRGFTVLGIAMDEEGKKAVAPFVERERFNVGGQPLPMNYPIVIGNDPIADKFGGLFGYPTSMLISRDGKQVKRFTGMISYEEVSRAIEALL